jgi:hypothetical protein
MNCTSLCFCWSVSMANDRASDISQPPLPFLHIPISTPAGFRPFL